ncbi:hypothetical protein [Polyangium sp. 15x6]|uniref:hypothetical protein n=1 Tax=Polyangium sp. 15x6 TaxID=3042687 RepID=UPI00249AFEC0|nr:hypothetical protein [Polyangium sp. 15x6]MDI3287789.1 hypothetical protein [Polyangium sp. 15x6]
MAWLPSTPPIGRTCNASRRHRNPQAIGFIAALVTLSLVLSGCASSRDPTMARIFEAPNVVHVCVRPPNVPKDKRIWGLTSDGTPFFGVREVDLARREGSPIYVFDISSPRESSRLLPIPYNTLECPARTPPPKPRVVAAKVDGKKKDEAKQVERPKPLPRPIARPPEEQRCAAYREPGQTRRRSGTGAAACTRMLVKRRAAEQAVADKQPPAAEPRPVQEPEPAEPRELPASTAQAHEDWGLSPAETSALAEDRARECLQGLCHARHPNFVPKSKKKPAETHNGQSLSTGSGSGGGASAPKPAAKPAPKTTTVKTTTKPVSQPKAPTAAPATTQPPATQSPTAPASAGAGMSGARPSTIEPGPHAGKSVPARGPQRDFSARERAQINEIGGDTGCHTCGTTTPGTRSGNFVPDHQPPNKLNTTGNPQKLYPQCVTCSNSQGGTLRHK